MLIVLNVFGTFLLVLLFERDLAELTLS